MDQHVYMIFDKKLGDYVAFNRYSRKPRTYGTKGAASNSITQQVGRWNSRGSHDDFEIHKFKLVRVEE